LHACPPRQIVPQRALGQQVGEKWFQFRLVGARLVQKRAMLILVAKRERGAGLIVQVIVAEREDASVPMQPRTGADAVVVQEDVEGGDGGPSSSSPRREAGRGAAAALSSRSSPSMAGKALRGTSRTSRFSARAISARLDS